MENYLSNWIANINEILRIRTILDKKNIEANEIIVLAKLLKKEEKKSKEKLEKMERC